jgi:hypothetical protein
MWAAAGGCLIAFTMIALVAESYKHRTGMGPGKDIVQEQQASSLSGDINMLWSEATTAQRKPQIATSSDKQVSLTARALRHTSRENKHIVLNVRVHAV